MHAHLRVVERSRVLIARARPRRAAVAGAVESRGRLRRRLALLRLCIRHRVRFDHRVHHLRIRERDRDADAPFRRLGESAALDLSPRLAGVGRLPQRRSRAARVEEVRAAHALPARRPHGVRVRRIERDVDESRLVGDELDELPRLAAVLGLVETALRIRVPRSAERGDVDDVRVRRMNDDAPDRLRLLESHHLPRDAAVGGLVDAAAGRDRVTRIRLARAGPHLHRVARRDGEHAHRDDALVVEHRAPRDAVVGGLPDAAPGGGGEERLRWRRDSRHVGHAAHRVRGADVPPAKCGDGEGVELEGLGGRRLGGRGR